MNQQQTDIELALDYANQGTAPTTIARLKSGWVFLALNQILRGTCLLAAEPVVASLDELSLEARNIFIDDMLKTGAAIMSVTGADRINYLFLGNKDPVLHVHLIPRYTDEDPAYRVHGPWKYQQYLKFEIERDQSLITDLTQALT